MSKKKNKKKKAKKSKVSKKDYLIKIRDLPIAWTNQGTYKNLTKELNGLLGNEELLQIENSITHLHLIIKEYTHQVPQYEYKVREEQISFTTKGTYKNLSDVVNNIPEKEEFFQITSTPSHLHLITRKPKKEE